LDSSGVLGTQGLIFEPVGFTYKVDPDFDVDRWRAEVEGRARAGQSLCTLADVVAAVRDGYSRTKELIAHLMEECAVSKRTVERLISSATEKGAIKALVRGKFILGKKAAIYLESTT
jgi:hypothetical protein